MRFPAEVIVGSASFSQLAAINDGLQDVLLHVEIVVVDGRHGLAEPHLARDGTIGTPVSLLL